MGLLKKWMPDAFFASFDEITVGFLKEKGIKLLLSDLDNTLAPYEEAVPNERVKIWVETLRENGITVALISNNTPERVALFNEALGLPVYPDAHKPGVKCYAAALKDLGVGKENAAVLGDQLLTDIYAGHRFGVLSLCVPPIRDKTNLFFRFKRRLERPVVRRYAKEKGYAPYFEFWKVKHG